MTLPPRSAGMKWRLALAVCLCLWIFNAAVFAAKGPEDANGKEKEEKRPELADEERRKDIVELMDQVFSVLNTIESQEDLNEGQKRARILDFLRTFRYGEKREGYVTVVGLDGIVRVEPNILELEGKDLHSFEDPNTFRIFEDFIRICVERGQGWSTYIWPKPGNKQRHVPTVALVRFFEELDYAVVLVYHPLTIWVEDYPVVYIDDTQPASPK